MKHALAVIALALGLGAAPAAAQTAAREGDAARGAIVYRERCSGCHSLDANRVGPAHRGVYGRRVGQAPGYVYSPALQRSRIAWTPSNLDRWLTDPQALIPGQRMNFRLSDAQLRADVIAYLRTQSATQSSAPPRQGAAPQAPNR